MSVYAQNFNFIRYSMYPAYRLSEMKASADAALSELQNDTVDSSNNNHPTSSISYVPESVMRQLHSYQTVDRDIPHRFLQKILSLSFHLPDDNRIAQQV